MIKFGRLFTQTLLILLTHCFFQATRFSIYAKSQIKHQSAFCRNTPPFVVELCHGGHNRNQSIQPTTITRRSEECIARFLEEHFISSVSLLVESQQWIFYIYHLTFPIELKRERVMLILILTRNFITIQFYTRIDGNCGQGQSPPLVNYKLHWDHLLNLVLVMLILNIAIETRARPYFIL